MSFVVGDRVVVIKDHRYNGREVSAFKVGMTGTVTKLHHQEAHRFTDQSKPHVCVRIDTEFNTPGNIHWIEENCLAPEEPDQEIRELFGIEKFDPNNPITEHTPIDHILRHIAHHSERVAEASRILNARLKEKGMY